MNLKSVQKMLQSEGIQTVMDSGLLKELVFPDENYHEVERVADGWKLNYVNRECKTHVTYECKKKFSTEEEVANVFLMCELEKHFGKQFYRSFYKNCIREVLEDSPNEYGLKRAMDLNAIPFRYVSLMGYEPYMTHSVLLYMQGEEWAVSYINHGGRKGKQAKTYAEFVDGMVCMLEGAFKLYLYDLFEEHQRDCGREIGKLSDYEVSILLGISQDIT
ncbi:MAG: hypothetical protein IKL07_00105 [Clostridium sp.]|nr:hypothetical protein [Clostridium sp.]